VTRYRWIHTRKAEGYSVTMCCATAQVSTSAFYDWLERSSEIPQGKWTPNGSPR